MANLRVDQFAIVSALTLSDIIPVIPQPGITAKQATLSDVKTLLGTPLANGIAIVDSINGTAGGVVGDLTKPFQTIAQAEAAVVAGETVLVYPSAPGIPYTDSALGKANINYHFMNGAIVDSGAFTMWLNPASCSYSITGDGEFTASAGGDIGQFTGGGTITFQAKKIYSTTGLVFGTNSCTLYADVQESIVSIGGRCFVLLSNATQYITAPFISSGGAAVVEATTSTSTIYLKADNVVASGTAAYDITGIARIWGITHYTGAIWGIISSGAGSSCDITFYDDIIVTNPAAAAVFYITNTTGNIDFYGKIISAGAGVGIGNTTVVNHVLHNDIQAASNAPVLSITSGTVRLKGKVKNTNVAATAYGVSITGGTLILDNATIVTSGGTYSVQSGIPATPIKIIGTLAQNVIFEPVNIVDIAGGTVQTDIDVE